MRRSKGRRGQRGAILLVALAVTIFAGTSLLLARIDGTRVLRALEAQASTRALAEARRALIGWSVGGGLDGGGAEHVPGVLPFPDRNSDSRGYDGRSDCVTGGLSDRHLIGRVPWAGETAPCPGRALGVELRDGSGEPLWYAVSRNLVNHRGGTLPDPPINPGLLDAEPAWPWIRLVDARGRVVTGSDGEPLEVAAVIIAPGRPLPGQMRNGIAPGATHYLDAVTVNGVTFDNADSDGCRDRVTGASAHSDCPGLAGEEFILYPDSRDTVDSTDAFNDRIAYITVEELLRVAEARALGAMAVVLEQYRSRYGAYPWVAPRVADPTADLPASFRVRVRGRNHETACLDRACTDTVITGRSIERALTTDAGTLATFTFPDFEFDLSPSRDGVPWWFVDNGWHRYVHVVVSGRTTGAGSSSPGACIGAGSGCLTVHASGVARTDVPALLIGSGPALPGQDRAVCADGCLQDYFELPDNANGGDAATRAPLAVGFNDQIRVAGPSGTSP